MAISIQTAKPCLFKTTSGQYITITPSHDLVQHAREGEPIYIPGIPRGISTRYIDKYIRGRITKIYQSDMADIELKIKRDVDIIGPYYNLIVKNINSDLLYVIKETIHYHLGKLIKVEDKGSETLIRFTFLTEPVEIEREIHPSESIYEDCLNKTTFDVTQMNTIIYDRR